MNAIVRPGAMEMRVNSIILPSKTAGSMEITKANFIRDARIVHVSLRFLDISPVKNIKKAAANEVEIIMTGVIEVIVSTVSP